MEGALMSRRRSHRTPSFFLLFVLCAVACVIQEGAAVFSFRPSSRQAFLPSKSLAFVPPSFSSRCSSLLIEPSSDLLRNRTQFVPSQELRPGRGGRSVKCASSLVNTGVPVGSYEGLEELLRRSRVEEEGFLERDEKLFFGRKNFRRRLCVLGSTGSIGTQTLQLAREFPDAFIIDTLAAAGNRVDLLFSQCLDFWPRVVCVSTPEAAMSLKRLFAESPKPRSPRCLSLAAFPTSAESEFSPPPSWPPEVRVGSEALESTAAERESQCVVAAVVGFAGLRPLLRALQVGKDAALANKEALVAAGPVFRGLFKVPVAEKREEKQLLKRSLGASLGRLLSRALWVLRRSGVLGASGISCGRSGLGRHGEFEGRKLGRLFPVDSEHSAVFQSLQGAPPSAFPLSKLLLCASGGPFFGKKKSDLEGVGVEEALRHPAWSMGAKITVDSATLMNKGLEVIEAHEAFQVPFDRIEVCVHPKALLHSAVEFADGALVGQLGVPDMKLAISYALTWPHRLKLPGKRLDLVTDGPLEFFKPDRETFECLDMAYAAGRRGGLYPACLSAANEVAVDRFLHRRLDFLGIPKVVRSVLEAAPSHLPSKPDDRLSLEDVEEADAWARRTAAAIVKERSSLLK